MARSIEALRGTGRPIGLLTDSPPAGQRQKLAALAHPEWFDAVIFARGAGGEKPAPGGFVAMAEALGQPPERLLMVGDDPYRDVLGALGAGYGLAAWIDRPGGLRGHRLDLFRRHRPRAAGEMLHLRSLADLLEGLRLGAQPAEGLSQSMQTPPPQITG